ncbi:hypothetical protein NC661_15120 [Aquibacillus koreensis]|uniref:Uncharacterized protein n=1 Tax=Aquibacillus koreensis TaxID=279446 RepID=A0A9X4AKS8_9BACI|nr:hypothetical protein [Aquibacillus koreensis]MCT2534396.1 hypothetical protein [Aquibacillus koreensis]MDC3421703.1 hypothetical protein [Aquibacillus koreensis]
MAKNERLNEEAALNNNLGSSTLRMNDEIKESQQKAKMKGRTKKDKK